MAANTITKRVADFLAHYPPFKYLTEHELQQISETVVVQYYPQNDYIFKEGDETHPFVFVLHKGRVELHKEFEEATKLIDVCERGDVFGVRAGMTSKPYIGSAQATVDTLIYAIPTEVFLPFMEANPRFSLFFAAGFAAGMPIVHQNAAASNKARKDLHFLVQESTAYMSEEDILILNPKEDVVYCSIGDSIRSAAIKMRDHKVGSILVLDTQRFPLGIVTDTDFTRKVLTGDVEPTAPIVEIMSSPVITIPSGATVAEFIILMMKRNVRHLVVTEDGTPQSPVTGIVSEHDVLLMHGNDPAVLVKRILRARDIEKIKEIRDRADKLIRNYLRQEISIPFITQIATHINDAIIQRAIDFSLKRMIDEGHGEPPLRYCWLSLGSEGREEQLLRTDQDNAIIYEDPAEGQEADAAAYFLKLGTYIVDVLVACGFKRCPGEVMASNPKWNQSLSGWKAHFSKWIHVPEPMALMHSSIFFDFRPGHGDTTLADALYEHIFAEISDTRQGFITFFAKNALQNPPPLSFFKNFIVEKSGEHKDRFDIKKRGMMPLADAARVLMYAEQCVGIQNTFKRFDKLAELIPDRAELFEEASMAYEILVRYRALNGFQNQDSGRFIVPESLNKIERKTLKTTFAVVEKLQTYLKQRFTLSYM